MPRRSLPMALLALFSSQAAPAIAQDIDGLRGQFAFNWLIAPAKTRCAAVDGRLLAQFKSGAFACQPEVVTNTASSHPARVCTRRSGGAEYLIFRTKTQCEDERQTQASNAD